MNLDNLSLYLSTHKDDITQLEQQELCYLLMDSRTPLSLKAKIILLFRENKEDIDIELFSNALHISDETAQQILENDLIETYFPIFQNSTFKLSKAYVIRLKNAQNFSTINNISDILNTIKNITQTDFFVMFEDDCIDDTFMLSIIAALVSKKKESLYDYIFSGIVDDNGRIHNVENYHEKKKLADMLCKKFIDGDIVRNIRELIYLINQEKIDLPFHIILQESKDLSSLKDIAHKNLELLKTKIEDLNGMNVNRLTKMYNLDDEDFLYCINEDKTVDKNLKVYICDAYTKIMKLQSKIDNKTVVFHFLLSAPAGFSFCLGSLFGSKTPFAVYNNENNNLPPVLNFRNKDPSRLRDIPKRVKHIKCEYNNESNNILITIFYLSSNSRIEYLKLRLEEQYGEYDFMKCVLADKHGNIPLKDWSIYIKEMYKHYNDTKSNSIKKRLFFIDLPSPLAFGLGINIENYENIDIFNLNTDNNGWIKISNLDELKK